MTSRPAPAATAPKKTGSLFVREEVYHMAVALRALVGPSFWDSTLTSLDRRRLCLAVCCVSHHETYFSRGWKGVEPNPHNYGAIRAKNPPKGGPCPQGTFEWVDDVTPGVKGRACFRSYPDAAAGRIAFLKVVLSTSGEQQAALDGDVVRLAGAMKLAGYYGASVNSYVKALLRSRDVILTATGW